MREAPLATLIRPVEQQEFFADYWESQVLHTRGDASRFAGMLDVAGAEALLRGRVESSRLVRIVRDGVTVAPSSYRRTRQLSRERELPDTLDLGRTWQHFAAGCTIVIQNVEFSDPQTECFRDTLEAQLQHRVEVHAFLAPAHNQEFGLPPHADPISAFIIQREGRRRWRIFEQTRIPLPRERGYPTPVGACLLDVVLEPGDGLYIPRGCTHEVTSVGVESFHLTVGIRVTTVNDLLEAFFRRRLTQLSLEPRARQALPVAWVSNRRAASAMLATQLEQLVQLSPDPELVGELVGELAEELVRSGQVTGPSSLAQARRLALELPLDATLRRRSFLFATKVDGQTGALVVVLPSEDWRVPAAWRRAVEFVLAGEGVFRVDELPTSDDPRELAHELVASGLVELANSEES